MPDFRLAAPAALLWAACALGVGVPQAAPFVAVLAALGAVLVLLAALLLDRSPLRGASAIVAVGLATAAAGLAVVAAIAPLRVDAALSAAAAAGERAQVAMRIESTPRRVAAGFDGETWWSICGTTVAMRGATQGPAAGGDGARRARAGVPIRLVAPASAERVTRLALGATALAEVSLRVEEPGGATAYSVFADFEPSVGEGPSPWLVWTGPLRAGLAGASSGTPGDGGDLLPGLAIGDETAVGSSLDAAMKASSLSHLTAVSGANCAIVTGLAFLASARIGLGRRLRIVVAAGALGLFVLLVGPGASVLRAAAMALVILIALARGRSAAGLPTLSLAAIVLLFHDPWLARDYGFALSVLATAGLLLLSRPLGEALAHLLLRRLAFTLAVPVAAQVACQPVLLLLAPGLPLYGVVANLLAAPAAPIATVLGSLACALLPFAPFAGQAIVWLAWLPSAWIAAVARFVSSLPGAALPWPGGSVGVALCVFLTITVGLVLARRHLPGMIARLAVIALVTAAGATREQWGYRARPGARTPSWLADRCVRCRAARCPGDPRRRFGRDGRRRSLRRAGRLLPRPARRRPNRAARADPLRRRPRRRSRRSRRAGRPCSRGAADAPGRRGRAPHARCGGRRDRAEQSRTLRPPRRRELAIALATGRGAIGRDVLRQRREPRPRNEGERTTNARPR
ncbi:hypothetical protein ATY41_10455 [Leifsonia xyli subsp. xyli]|uniref:ComEC/Rec2-related protein domain-containing protein n=1 Tax=Leifsonia xyli subsp. xyli TaxID=59736 RepID=A0A1E2SKZ2_LEIXY|nr:hypothetical protein ATY41_10455 [Leifsonia xyli subsp. xyli]